MYTDLIRIERPYGTTLNIIAPLNAKAYAGETVEIFVYIKNQYSITIGIKPVAFVNGVIPVVFSPENSNIQAGVTNYFIGHFTMPNADANIRAESYWHGSDNQWHFEDYQTRTINLAAAEEPEEPDLKRLVINRDTTAGGYVTASPVPSTGATYDGYYLKGTTVYVTAHPNTGYEFESWSGELTDTTNLTAPVYMTENRTITAHFKEEEVILETLEVDIAPIGKGHVTTTPDPITGYKQWTNNSTGQFSYGASVEVMAHPVSGYVFEKWTDEIVGGVNLQNPAMVQLMTEHRAVKCHFVPIGQVSETLEVDIAPIGKGYVTTNPASNEGKTTWHHNEEGQFIRGTNVQVTAHPNTGYAFEKWSDEIVGGISYQNPEMVQIMNEHRAVKCHFRALGDIPPEEGLDIVSLTLDGWSKVGGTLGTTPLTISPGETLRTQVTIEYSATKEFVLPSGFWVSLVIDPFRDETFKYNITLPASSTVTSKIFTFDVPITADDTLLHNKTYDLWVEFDNGLQAKASGAVIITGMPETTSIMSIIPMMIMVMMMSMMMGMMGVQGGTDPKPIVIKLAKGVRKGVEVVSRFKGKK